MVAVCSRPVLKIAPLLQDDQVAVFFFRVLRTGSIIKQNKQGEKKESAYFQCAQKVLNNLISSLKYIGSQKQKYTTLDESFI